MRPQRFPNKLTVARPGPHLMGQVVIEQMERFLEDDQKDNPPQTVITIAEARKLILDWIAARDKWYAEREAKAPPTA